MTTVDVRIERVGSGDRLFFELGDRGGHWLMSGAPVSEVHMAHIAHVAENIQKAL